MTNEIERITQSFTYTLTSQFLKNSSVPMLPSYRINRIKAHTSRKKFGKSHRILTAIRDRFPSSFCQATYVHGVL